MARGNFLDNHIAEAARAELRKTQQRNAQKAIDAEIDHRARPNRQLDDDEFRASCGLPPRRPRQEAA